MYRPYPENTASQYVLAPSLSSRVAAANPHLNQGIWTSGASGQALRKPGGMGELPQFPCPSLSMVFRVFTIFTLEKSVNKLVTFQYVDNNHRTK